MKTKNTRSLILAAFATLTFCSAVLCSTPPISYKIRIDPADLSGFDIEMRMTGKGGTVRMAMGGYSLFRASIAVLLSMGAYGVLYKSRFRIR